MRVARTVLACIVLAVGVLFAAGCGGASSSSRSSAGDVVAQVGETPITRPMLSHWMLTLGGGDYYQLSHKHTLASGLVSDPPNYAGCVTQLEAVRSRPAAGKTGLTAAQLLTKCRQLYQGLKAQALEYLIGAQASINAYREVGVTATHAEVMHFYQKIKAEQFATEAAQREFFTARHLSLADELFVVKLDLLDQKIQQRLSRGGKAQVAKLVDASAKWTADTNCQPGYVVRHCKQYTTATQASEASTNAPSPAVLMEQVATLTGVPCVNKEACGGQ